MIIAIDGEAGAGKTTVAALVAERLGCPILESGSLYRALAWKALREGADTSNEQEITALADKTSIDVWHGKTGSSVIVDGRDVTSELSVPNVGEAASAVAEFHGVRRRLLPMQRKAAEHGDLVAEGRDMGSVVFPDADFKFFLKASLDVRAERRRSQLEERSKKVPFEKVREYVMERDGRDAGREWSPMKAAADAVVIDTSETDAESVVDMILGVIGTEHLSQRDKCSVPITPKLLSGVLRNRIHRIWYMSVKSLAQVLFVCLFRVRVFGRSNVPKRGGAILASNHQSYLDPAIIAAGLRREIHFMARDSLFEIPVFGALIRSLNAFPVKRDGVDREALRKAIRIIAAGGLVVIFPEGTRHDSGTLGKMRSGAAFVGKKARCSIIPVGIQGANKAWPIRYRVSHLAPIRIGFGQPIKSDGKEAKEMIKEVVEGIEDLLK